MYAFLWFFGACVGLLLFLLSMWAFDGASRLPESPQPSLSKASPAPDPTKGFTQDEVRDAALDILWATGQIGSGFGATDSFWGGTIAQCDAWDANLASLRARFANYPNIRVRRELSKWLDFYTQRVAAARADIVSGKRKKEMDVHDERRRTENARKEQLLEKLK